MGCLPIGKYSSLHKIGNSVSVTVRHSQEELVLSLTVRCVMCRILVCMKIKRSQWTTNNMKCVCVKVSAVYFIGP